MPAVGSRGRDPTLSRLSGKIVNALSSESRKTHAVDATSVAEGRPVPQLGHSALLSEDEVKAAVKAHLELEGWQVQVAWGHERGIDIAARRGHDVQMIEAKGEAANPPQQANYFIGALGELVQRLADPVAAYGLALPDNQQYRRLVDRLPPLVRARLNLVVYFVDRGASRAVRSVR